MAYATKSSKASKKSGTFTHRGFMNLVLETSEDDKNIVLGASINTTERSNTFHHKEMMKSAAKYFKKNEEYLTIKVKYTVVSTKNPKTVFAILASYKGASGNTFVQSFGIPNKAKNRTAQQERAYDLLKDSKEGKERKAYIYLVSSKSIAKKEW